MYISLSLYIYIYIYYGISALLLLDSPSPQLSAILVGDVTKNKSCLRKTSAKDYAET